MDTSHRALDHVNEQRISRQFSPTKYELCTGSPLLSPSSSRPSPVSPPLRATALEQRTQNLSSSERQDLGYQPVRYSEMYSPDPERVYTANSGTGGDKEVYENDIAVDDAATFAFHGKRAPSMVQFLLKHKRLAWITGALAIVILVVAIICGAVLGTRKSRSQLQPSSAENAGAGPNDRPNPSNSSQSGAFNGSGIAVASAYPGKDETVYVFYQDYKAQISWKLIKADGTFTQSLGIINDQESQPLNGTPLSVANYQMGQDNQAYHLFYINDKYDIVERILQTGTADSDANTPTWSDGPLTSARLKALSTGTIGLQACYWTDYTDDPTSTGLKLWYASSETQFQQITWANGSSTWRNDTSVHWTNLDGHAGVGCQTWDNDLKYVFFVDLDQSLALYWRDNNDTAPSTTDHPTMEWNRITTVNISDVGKSSSLGWTNYLLYQTADSAIRGVNVTWAAENTTLATSNSGSGADAFTIEELDGDAPVPAFSGTHMCITTLKTASSGERLHVFFQQFGDDISLFTRDLDQQGGKWQQAPRVV